MPDFAGSVNLNLTPNCLVHFFCHMTNKRHFLSPPFAGGPEPALPNAPGDPVYDPRSAALNPLARPTGWHWRVFSEPEDCGTWEKSHDRDGSKTPAPVHV